MNDIDQAWQCGGHEVTARDLRVAEARKSTDALISADVPIFIPESGAKVTLRYAPGINPTFASASELRDSLLASYPEAARFGYPVVSRNLEQTAPAWGWAIDLVHQRGDWRPALGIALQHAATDGGELARLALVDLMAHFSDSAALFPWTESLASKWPELRPDRTSATGWGRPDYRLDAIARDQKTFLSNVETSKSSVFLDGYGAGGEPIIAPKTNQAQLKALLDTSAKAGRFPDGDKGPWSWLQFELMFGEAWIRPAFLQIVHRLDAGDTNSAYALLDWFAEEQDLWQFVQLIESWVANPPSWWTTRADTKPAGWKRTIRTSFWPGVTTLGDAAIEALRRAKWQAATPPVVDLPQLYGSSIS